MRTYRNLIENWQRIKESVDLLDPSLVFYGIWGDVCYFVTEHYQSRFDSRSNFESLQIIGAADCLDTLNRFIAARKSEFPFKIGKEDKYCMLRYKIVKVNNEKRFIYYVIGFKTGQVSVDSLNKSIAAKQQKALQIWTTKYYKDENYTKGIDFTTPEFDASLSEAGLNPDDYDIAARKRLQLAMQNFFENNDTPFRFNGKSVLLLTFYAGCRPSEQAFEDKQNSITGKGYKLFLFKVPGIANMTEQQFRNFERDSRSFSFNDDK